MSGFAGDISPSPTPTASRRRYRRWAVDLPAYVETADDTHYCLLYDITPAGARLRVVSGGELAPGAEVRLDLEGYGRIPALVRHAALDVVGVQFLHGEHAAARLYDWLVDTRPPRRQPRHGCDLPAVLSVDGGEIACSVTDLSRAGAAVHVVDGRQPATGMDVMLRLPTHCPIAASVRHAEGESLGLMLIDGYQGELPPP